MSENDENWEEDTNDTEIMKNINSLLDSDLYDYKEEALLSKQRLAAFGSNSLMKSSNNYKQLAVNSCINHL